MENVNTAANISSDEKAALMEQGFTPADNYKEVKGEELSMAPALEQSASLNEADQSKESEKPIDTQQTEEVKLDKYTFGDKEYSTEEILAALDDHSNKDKWQKSFTERDQKLAEHRKNVDTQLEKISAIQQDEKLMNTLKDFLGDDHPLFSIPNVTQTNSQVQNTEIPEETQEYNSSSAIEELQEQINVLQAEKELDTEILQLRNQYPQINDESMDEILELAVDKGIENLEDAYKIALYDAAETSAISKAHSAFEEAEKLKEIPESDGRAPGDKEVPTPQMVDRNDLRNFVLKEYGDSIFGK
tara:strand:+ start:249 stop:1154 length:906 start_codon:yes stop_codon:yes gene_type:complete